MTRQRIDSIDGLDKDDDGNDDDNDDDNGDDNDDDNKEDGEAGWPAAQQRAPPE